MNVIDTDLPGVQIIEPRVFRDARGFFMESWNARDFERAGLPVTFVQDNHSSSARGVLRGLHYQLRQPQGKLVRCVRGAIFDVAVDLRRDSASFGQWFGTELSEENCRMLWIPPGFAHGFLALGNRNDVLYKTTTLYDTTSDRAIRWNDPDIAIAWPGAEAPLLSDKDRAAPLLRDAALQ